MLSFCLDDGSLLVGASGLSDEPTVIRKTPFSQPAGTTIRQGVNPLFTYLAIALLALIIGGAIVAWFKSESNGPITNNNIASTNRSNETSKPLAIPPSNQKSVPTNKPETQPTSGDNDDIKNEARTALNEWVQTLVDHDFDRHMSFYADRLDFYNQKRDADISYVRDKNLKLFNKYSRFGLVIRNVRADVTANGQVATTFESVYDFRGSRIHSGIDRGTEIRWKWIEGIWKIVSER